MQKRTVLILIGLVLCAGSAWSAPYTLTTPLSKSNTADTFISEKFLNTNYGDADSLKSGGGSKKNRTLMHFTPPALPGGSVVSSATLYLPIRDYKGSILESTEYALHAMKSSWDADQATWSMADSATSWSAGGDYDTTTVSKFVVSDKESLAVFDITSLINSWRTSPATNFGFMIRSTNEQGIIVIDPDLGLKNLIRVHKATIFESSDQVDSIAPTPYVSMTVQPPDDLLPPVASAIGEITPHLLPRGAPSSFTLLVRVTMQGPGYDTGIDRIRLPLPAGLTNVTHAKTSFEGVDLTPVVSGSASTLILDLPTRIDSSGVISLTFSMQATGADTAETFSVNPTLDDTQTLFGAITPSPGDVNGMNDGNHMRVTVPGLIERIEVYPALDSVSADTTITFTANGYDNEGNDVPTTVIWTKSSLIGTLDPLTGFFDPIRVSEGWITATEGTVAGSLYTRIVPGDPVAYAIAPADTAITMDDTVDFVSIAIDGDFNWYQPVTNWSVADPSVASIDTSGGLTPAEPGSTLVIGTFKGRSDTSTVSITPGRLASITIDPMSATVAAGGQIAFEATAYDAHGNETSGSQEYVWAGGDAIGSIDPATGVFSATTSGRDVVRVSHTTPNVITTEGEVIFGATITGFTDSITVVSGPASNVTISPASTTIGIGGAVQFTYQSSDAFGNPAAESPAWSETGGVGTIDANGLFAATTGGNGNVIVTVGAVADTADVEVLDNGGLVVETVIEGRDRVTQGEAAVSVGLEIRNESGSDITSFAFDLTFEGPSSQPLNSEYTVVASDSAAFDTLANGATDTVWLEVNVDSLATTGIDVTIRGVASGELVGNGSPIQTDVSQSSGTWSVTEPPVLVDLVKTLFPKTAVPGGKSGGFFLGVRNVGGASLDLDSTSCLVLTDGADSLMAPITGVVNLPADSSVVSLLFDEALLPGTFDPGDYEASLVLSGADGNGAVYAKSVSTVNNKVAVLPPHIQAVVQPLAGGVVYPGSTDVALLSMRVTNLYPQTKTLTSITFSNDSSPIGSFAQRDGVFENVTVYRDVDRSSDVSDGDVVVTSGAFVNGQIAASGLALALAPSDSIYFLLAADVSLANAPAAFVLDAAVGTESDIVFSPSSTILATFPLDSPGNPVVDGSIVAQISLDSDVPEELPAGSVDSLAFAFRVPSNGFQGDSLFSITLRNRGEANAADLASVRLWRDGGDGSFDRGAGDDSLLGSAVPAGNNWFWGSAGLWVPPGGSQLFASVSIVEAPSGGVLQFSIPAGGLQYLSTNDGPVDGPAYTPTLQIIGGSQGVSISALTPSPITAAFPGQNDVRLYSFTLTNLDTTEAIVSSLLLRNASYGATHGDSVIAAVKVVDDTSGAVFGAGAFFDNAAFLPLQGLTIEPSGERRIAIAVDVAQSCVSQNDSVRVVIDSSGAFGFPEERIAIGTFPVERTTAVPVRGLRAENFDVPALADGALIPGESGRLAFRVFVPSNGCLPDTLETLQIDNLGTAVRETDISAVSITTSGAPGPGALPLFGAGDKSWFRNDLAIVVPAGGIDLHVWIDVAAGATGESTVELRLPTEGASLASGRIGPSDEAIASAALFTITTVPIFAQFIDGGVDVVSTQQAFDVTFEVSNPSVTDTIHSISTPGLAGVGGSISEVVSPEIDPARKLAPGENFSVTWTVYATTGGSLSFETSFGAKPVGSEEIVGTGSVLSTAVTVQVPPDSVTLDIDVEIPTEIVRGSFGQELLNVNITHENGNPLSAPARLEALTFRLDDETGAIVDPSNFLSQLDVVDLEANRRRVARLLPADFGNGAITVTLDSTIVLRSGNDADLAFEFSFREESDIDAFTIVWETTGALALFDPNSGSPLAYRLDSTVVSDTIPVVDPPAGLDVSVLEGLPEQINRGDDSVVVMDFTLAIAENETQTADLLVNEIRMLPASADFPFSSLVVEQDGFAPYFDGSAWVQAEDTLGHEHVLILPLFPSIRVTSEATLNIRIHGAVREDAMLGPYTIGLLDSLFTDPEPDGPTPSETAESPEVTLVLEEALHTVVKIRTEDVAVEGTDLVDSGFVITGTRNVPAFELEFVHGSGDSLSDIDVSSVIFSVRTTAGDPVPLETVLDRARLLRDGATIASAAPIEPGLSTLALTPPPADVVRIASGGSVTLGVELDIRADAAAGDYVIAVAGEGVSVVERNQGGAVAVDFTGDAANTFFTSALAIRRQSDAVDVTIDFTLPATTVPGASIDPAGTVRIEASGDASVSDVHLTSLFLEIEGDAGALDPASVLASAMFTIDGESSEGEFMTDGVLFTFAEPIVLMPGEERAFALAIGLAASVSPDRFRLRLPVDGVTIVEAGPVVRAAGTSDRSTWAHFAERDFASSVRNYPNPFSAREEATTLAFYAREAGTATIRVFTGLGDAVWSTEVPVSAPGFVEIEWNGANGDGNRILSGVYLAWFEMRYENGTIDRKTHKIAVLN